MTYRDLFLTNIFMNQRSRHYPAPFKGWNQVSKKTLDPTGYRREKFPDMQGAYFDTGSSLRLQLMLR
jgi:hypothetical protein